METRHINVKSDFVIRERFRDGTGKVVALPDVDFGPARVRLVCADKDVYRAYTFQWNMWFAERKPEHNE